MRKSKAWLRENYPEKYEEAYGTERSSKTEDSKTEGSKTDEPHSSPVRRAKGEPYSPYRSKTEERYALQLESHGGVLQWWYEPFNFRLSDGTYYKADFLVMRASHLLEVHEIKGGYVRETGRAKFKIAALMYPCFTWRLMQQKSKKSPWEEILTLPKNRDEWTL